MASSLLGQPRRPSGCCIFLVVLLLFATVLTQPCSCRPLALNNNLVIDLPTETVGAPSAAREELADKYGKLWLLNMKPRGKPPPSAPSKRTNGVNT